MLVFLCLTINIRQSTCVSSNKQPLSLSRAFFYYQFKTLGSRQLLGLSVSSQTLNQKTSLHPRRAQMACKFCQPGQRLVHRAEQDIAIVYLFRTNQLAMQQYCLPEHINYPFFARMSFLPRNPFHVSLWAPRRPTNMS